MTNIIFGDEVYFVNLQDELYDEYTVSLNPILYKL